MRKKVAFSLVLVMLFSLFPQLMVFSSGSETALAAGTSLATLEDISGGIFVKKGGGVKEFQAINGMALTQGDSVRTAKEGSATVTFYTGSKMAVGSSTSFTVNKLKETRDSGGKLSVKLKSGTVWNKVKSLVNMEDEYEIETPTAVMGVRGTMLFVGVDPTTGETTMMVMDGSVAAQYNYMRNAGAQEQLVLMGNSINMPPEFFQNSMFMPPPPPPPPPPAPINMNSLVDRQDPFILANMALDVVDRMQELQRQSELLLADYENTNNQGYLQGALQQSQNNSLLASLSQQYMNTVQNSAREQQRNLMNQVLEQRYQTNLDAMNQQMQEISNQAQETRQNAIEEAQQRGIDPDQIQRLLQNAVTARATAGAGAGGTIVMPPTPPTPPSTGGGSSSNNNKLVVSISDFKSTNVNDTSAAFEWTAAKNATSIGLQYSNDGQNWSDYSGNLTVNDAGVSVTGLIPNTSYSFRLVISGGPNRGNSNMITIMTEKTKLTDIEDITGTARAGEMLKAGTVLPDGATVTYQWQIAASVDEAYADIEGAKESQYTLSANDVNKYIRVAATGTGDYTGIVYSQSTVPVADAIPAEWSSPEPSVSVDTEGDEPLIIVEYKANQSGEVYYMITEEGLQLEENPSFLEMVMDEAERDQIILKGSEECSSEELERLEIPYSGKIHANKDYDLYMVLKGVNDNWAIEKKITFHIPQDNNPPVLTAEVDYNNDSEEVIINHSVQDYDELYDLYVRITPKDMDPQPTPDELTVKEYGINNGMAYSGRRSGTENDEVRIPLANSQPGEYLVYLVAQDHSSADETRDGLYSEVLQFLVTKPSPSTN